MGRVKVWPFHVQKRIFYNLSPINLDIVILEYARAFGEEKNSIGGTTGSVYSGGQLTPFSGPRMLLNLDPNNCSNHRLEHCPPQAGPVGTRPDECIASSASLLTLIRPSLWDRGNLDSSPQDRRPLLQGSSLYAPKLIEAFFSD